MHKYGIFGVHYHDYAQSKLETGTYAQVWKIYLCALSWLFIKKIRDRNLCTSVEQFCVCIIMIMPEKL